MHRKGVMLITFCYVESLRINYNWRHNTWSYDLVGFDVKALVVHKILSITILFTPKSL